MVFGVPVKVICDSEPEQIGLSPETEMLAVGLGLIVSTIASLTEGQDPSDLADIVITALPPLITEAGI